MIYHLVLKSVHDQMIRCYQGRQCLSSIGHCVPYRLVVLLTNECGDTGMAYRWDIRTKFACNEQTMKQNEGRVGSTWTAGLVSILGIRDYGIRIGGLGASSVTVGLLVEIGGGRTRLFFTSGVLTIPRLFRCGTPYFSYIHRSSLSFNDQSSGILH